MALIIRTYASALRDLSYVYDVMYCKTNVLSFLPNAFLLIITELFPFSSTTLLSPMLNFNPAPLSPELKNFRFSLSPPPPHFKNTIIVIAHGTRLNIIMVMIIVFLMSMMKMVIISWAHDDKLKRKQPWKVLRFRIMCNAFYRFNFHHFFTSLQYNALITGSCMEWHDSLRTWPQTWLSLLQNSEIMVVERSSTDAARRGRCGYAVRYAHVRGVCHWRAYLGAGPCIPPRAGPSHLRSFDAC